MTKTMSSGAMCCFRSQISDKIGTLFCLSRDIAIFNFGCYMVMVLDYFENFVMTVLLKALFIDALEQPVLLHNLMCPFGEIPISQPASIVIKCVPIK